MAIVTQLIWTVLPNGVTASGRLRASILVSPSVRVTAPDTRKSIAEHPWFGNWPAALLAAGRLKLAFGRFDNPEETEVPVDLMSRPATVHTPTRTMWTDIFLDSFAAPPAPAQNGPVERLGEIDAFDAYKTLLRSTITERGAPGAPSILEETSAREAQTSLWARLRSLDLGDAGPAGLEEAKSAADEDPREFHRLVAAVTAYRALACEVALVLDVEFTASLPAIGWIRMRAPTLPLLPGSDQQVPRTAIEYTGTPSPLFRSLLAKDAPSGVPQPDQRMREGFGSLTDARLIHLHSKTTRCKEGDPVALTHRAAAQSLPPLPDQLLLMNPRVAELVEVWSARANALVAAGSASILFADDLVCGMAIDVKHVGGGSSAPWRSFCERQGQYATGPVGPDALVLPQGRTAVAVQIGELASKNGRMASDVFLRFDGWSLVCDRPGVTVDEADGASLKTIPIPVLRDALEPPPGSLPKLRYGESYRCRARAIDVAGNDMSASGGVPPADDEMIEFSFFRHEPVRPPMIVGRTVPPANASGPRDPQATCVVAVGYTFRTDEGTNDHTREEVRYLLPPKASPTAVEFAGHLDRVKHDADAFAILQRLDAEPPQIFADGQPIAHLPDPFAHGVRMRRLPGSAELTHDFRGSWPRPSATKLVVQPKREAHSATERERLVDLILSDPENAGKVDDPLGKDDRPSPSGSTVTIHVRPGFRDVVQVSSWMGPEESRHRVYDTSREEGLLRVSMLERSSKTADLQRDLATPSAEIEIAHPVLSPLFRPRILAALAPLERRPDGTTHATRALSAREVELAFRTLYHRATTGCLELVARWTEPGDIGATPPTMESVVTEREGRHLHASQSAPTLVRLELMQADIATQQRFEDGKYRLVEYALRGQTSFGEYFLPDDMKRQALRGSAISVHVPATEPPPPPGVARTIPTFRTTLVPGGGQVTHARLVGLRIYLERPWNASGDGELLAALEHCRSEQEPVTHMAVQNVSTWANDPIQNDRVQGRITSLVFRHMRSSSEPFPDGIVPVDGADAFELERGDERGLVVKLNSYLPRVVDGELACDIDVGIEDPQNDGVAYPFVRLALARYQRHAVRGAALSDVVFATFVQLPAARTLELHETGHRIKAVVRGPGSHARMCFQFVPRWRHPIPTSTNTSNERIESSDPALLVPPPDAAQWRTLEQGAWTFEEKPPGGNHWLIITEEEEIAGARRLTTVCKLELG